MVGAARHMLHRPVRDNGSNCLNTVDKGKLTVKDDQ